MAELRTAGRRVWVLAGAAVVLVVVLVATRGLVALLAAATVCVIAAYVLGLPPLLRPDGIDWDWRPGGTTELRPEPGIAALSRLLAPSPGDTEAPAQLHRLVAALAADRAPHGAPREGPLATYLAGPPRRLSPAEAATIITALEDLSPEETP
ncbi:hypothetical protein [Oryzobacter terrae]|uniref:hypothetical protein n=1 Tax=Oryzobacter terrae TaxID=1620385 RepID=UPI00366C84C5